MAGRKRKNLTLEEKIEFTKTDIATKETELKELKSQLKTLEAEKNQEDLQKLHDLVVASGKTIDEVAAMLKSE